MPPSFAPSCSIWPFFGLRSRSAGRRSPKRAAARRAALELLAEAEESLGASVVLQRERQSYAAGLSGKPIASAAPGDKAPETVWEHYALGRYLLRGGELDAAENEFQQALDQAPEAFWPNYYAGMCAFRQGRYQQALNVFYACVALAPQSANCFYNRALAHAALEQRQAALDDLRRALKLQPDHGDSLALLQQLQ